MADIFLSYVRADRERVAKLVAALRAEGFDVWWDDDIPPGAPWETTIEQALFAAKTVIVCWSAGAIASDNVKSEARWARTNGRLLQVFLDASAPPLFFGERQGVDLSRWRGERDAVEVRRLGSRLGEMLAAPAAPRVADPSPRADARRVRPARSAWVAAGLALVLLVGAGLWFAFGRHGAPAPGVARIAVLPFDVPGRDDRTVAFAATLTDQILTELNDGKIPVVSRSEALAARGDTDRLAALGVGLVFDGSIAVNAGKITVQVHANDPRQHVAVWSHTDQDRIDALDALRTRVARAVVGVLACSNRALKPGGLSDPELLGRYLRACDLFLDPDAGGQQTLSEMLEDLRAVVRQAPNFVPARTDLAKFDALLASAMPSAQAAAMRAESAAEATKALAIESRSPDAYLALALARPDADWAGSEALLRQGVAVDPDWPHTNGMLADLLAATGRNRESMIHYNRAAAADLQIDWGPAAARAACHGGDTETTIIDLRARVAARPGDTELLQVLGACLADAGRYAERRALPLPVNPVADAVATAMLSKSAADRARARLLLLERAKEDPQYALVSLSALGYIDDAFAVAPPKLPAFSEGSNPALLFGVRTAALRRDPRFLALAARYGLLDFWRKSGKWPDFCSDPALPYDCKTGAPRDRALKNSASPPSR